MLETGSMNILLGLNPPIGQDQADMIPDILESEIRDSPETVGNPLKILHLSLCQLVGEK
jgi:hypothetical protein